MSQCKVQIVSALLSVDSVHQSCAGVSTRYKAQATMGLYHLVSAFEHCERIASLWIKLIPDVQWVILIILDSHLTSFDAWQLDRHRDELMFQSDSWRTSPTFADEQAVSLSLRARRR
jgi:hypothetical protein